LSELFGQLKICSHNINGLKGSRTKFLNFLDWANNQQMDIISISETNLTAKEYNFLIPEESDYSGIWTGKADKIKGSGMGIMISSKWERHIGPKKFIDHYLVHIQLIFRGCTLSIIQT